MAAYFPTTLGGRTLLVAVAASGSVGGVLCSQKEKKHKKADSSSLTALQSTPPRRGRSLLLGPARPPRNKEENEVEQGVGGGVRWVGDQ